MEFTEIVNLLIQYGSVLAAIMMALVTAVTMIVEVVKRLLPKVPTDLVVFVVSIALTVLALYVYASIMDITVMWYYAVGAVTVGFGVAYAAMFGWEKFAALWSRLKSNATVK
jgi:hypothetical protein